jgi:hypothetical protein
MPKGIHNKPLNLDVLTKRYELLSDNSGHEYVIAVGDDEEFYEWVQSTESEEVDEDDEIYEGRDFEDRRMTRHNLTFLDPQGWK